MVHASTTLKNRHLSLDLRDRIDCLFHPAIFNCVKVLFTFLSKFFSLFYGKSPLNIYKCAHKKETIGYANANILEMEKVSLLLSLSFFFAHKDWTIGEMCACSLLFLNDVSWLSMKDKTYPAHEGRTLKRRKERIFIFPMSIVIDKWITLRMSCMEVKPQSRMKDKVYVLNAKHFAALFMPAVKKPWNFNYWAPGCAKNRDSQSFCHIW